MSDMNRKEENMTDAYCGRANGAQNVVVGVMDAGIVIAVVVVIVALVVVVY